MASLLISRAHSATKAVTGMNTMWKTPASASRFGASKPGSRPLTSAWSKSGSVKYIVSPTPSIAMQVRAYSSRDARRAQRQATQTQVREREWESTQDSQVAPFRESPPVHQQQQQQHYEPSDADNNYYRDPNATTESLINTGVLGHLRKVYTLVGTAAGVAALGGAGSMLLGIAPGVAMASGLLALVPLLATIFMDKSKVLMRQNMLLGAAAMMGVGIGPMLGAVALPTILLALGGTGAIFAGFSLAALKAPSGSYLKFGGIMMGGLFVILGAILVSMFGPMIGIPASIVAAASSINLYGGLLLLSLFIAYDTQAMIDRAAAGETDHVSDALNMFIDVWGVFVRLLAIFGNND